MAETPQYLMLRWDMYSATYQRALPRLLESQRFSDVTLACEGRQVKCHKLVLSACSPYLERLLVDNPCEHPVICLNDIRYQHVVALIHYMYKGEVKISQDELPALLKVAGTLMIRGLSTVDTSSDIDAGEIGTSPEQPPRTRPTDTLRDWYSKEQSQKIKSEPINDDYNNDMAYHHNNVTKAGCSYEKALRNPLSLKAELENKLFLQNAMQNIVSGNVDFLNSLNVNSLDIYKDLTKWSQHLNQETRKDKNNAENDYYKTWLEQNGELEVSLLKAGERKQKRPRNDNANEIELIPHPRSESQPKKRGRPPIFKHKSVDIGETVLKSDLDQFLEGKEISSSGLSRKDLEKVMMGKFNPNRRYSNEAMWAALMDVKRGGSIYRAAQTHKVPRKSLRNWMKRCHIKSSFPMPQQLKQFVEKAKKQKEIQNNGEDALQDDGVEVKTEDVASDFGQHFLSYMDSKVASDEELCPEATEETNGLRENGEVVTCS